MPSATLRWLLVAGILAALTVACGRGGESAAPSGEMPTAAPQAPAAPEAAPAQSEAQKAAPAPQAPTAQAGGAATISEAAREEAEEIFASRCATCHGASGMGDGPAGKALTPPPRNFHDKAWQASVTDAHIEKIIQYGGPAVGKSAAMPPNPDLVGKPQVMAALMEKVRSFGK